MNRLIQVESDVKASRARTGVPSYQERLVERQLVDQGKKFGRCIRLFHPCR